MNSSSNTKFKSLAKAASAQARRVAAMGNALHYGNGRVPPTPPNQTTPLSGARVFIFAHHSSSSSCSVNNDEEDAEYQTMGCVVISMGGMLAHTLNRDVTHAIFMVVGNNNNNKQHQSTTTNIHLADVSSETIIILNTCLAMNIPVVGTDWLTYVGQLKPGEHWSEVDIGLGFCIPSVVQEFNYTYGHSSSGSSSSSSSRRDDSPAPHIDYSPRTKNIRSNATAKELMNASISETYKLILVENPDALETEAVRRAMELSMLDFAIVVGNDERLGGSLVRKNSFGDESPHDILQISKDATSKEIKNAYKRRALETHPDKGGEPGVFDSVAQAYRLLLDAANNTNRLPMVTNTPMNEKPKTTEHWDNELKEHSSMVDELFGRHGNDLSDSIRRQDFALERLGLCHKDAGYQNVNEKKQVITNSCFYLSLAVSYLHGIEALAVWQTPEINDDSDFQLLRKADEELIKVTALQLKRTIETAVLSAHPEWAMKGLVGEEVQAFADFLVYCLESTFLSDWAIVVFDTSSGFVDIYKGKYYKDENEGFVLNTLTLRHVPGHYQPLITASASSLKPSLKRITSTLEQCGVLYVVTDGTA